MIVLSDGQPANATLNLTREEEERAPGNALKGAVQDVIKSGIDVVGIGIEDSSVKKYYPQYVVINDVNDLSGVMFTQLSNILTGGKVAL